MILYALQRGKPRVVACSRSARQQGVAPGMWLAEAQALWPHPVRIEEHDPADDRRALQELAAWCQRFSPSVALDDADEPDSLLLDMTGCNATERAETQTILAALKKRGYHAAAVVADTVGAAWAVAHHGVSFAQEPICLIPPGRHHQALQSLPVEALRLPAAAVPILHDLNLFRVEQLLALPRAELPSRFGREILQAIDRTLGRVPELIVPERPREPLEACWDFEYPIPDGRLLLTIIEHLLDWLLAKIPTHYWGIQRLACTLHVVGHDPMRFPVALLRPTASKRDLMELTRLQVERLRVPAEVSRITLLAESIQALEFRQDEMFGGTAAAGWNYEVTGLLERLGGRLGDGAIVYPQLQPDPQPEFAWCEALANAPLRKPSASRLHARPVFLHQRPRPFKKGSGVVSAAETTPDPFFENGPERIETGWWRGHDIRRDYYIAETPTGERLWVFCDLCTGKWYQHGVFG